MSSTIQNLKKEQREKLPGIRPGDRILVFEKIKEGKKERTKIFKGIVLARKHGRQPGATITVRSEIKGVGLERIFPLHSPAIEKIEVIKKGRPRRSKLYYLRKAKGKRAKIKKGK